MATDDNTQNAHFVASLKVEKVERISTRPPVNQMPDLKREITEVTHMTLKAQSLESLKTKLAAHISLVEED